MRGVCTMDAGRHSDGDGRTPLAVLALVSFLGDVVMLLIECYLLTACLLLVHGTHTSTLLM